MELTKVLRIPGAVRALIKWKPFSVTSFRIVSILAQRGYNFGTVIDGGANVGQFSRAVTEMFPSAEIYAIEALPKSAASLRQALRDRPRVKVLEVALGEEDGEGHFYRNAYSHASSMLPMTRKHSSTFPASKELGQVSVTVRTLDTLFGNEKLASPVLLKLDLQGSENQALSAASTLLKRVDHVLVEVAFEDLYKGQSSFRELDRTLGAAGFVHWHPVDFLLDDAGNILQMDAVFSKERTD